MKLDRRNFLGGIISLGALGGCRAVCPGRTPDIRLGVISDIHVMTPGTCAMFRRSLRYFRDRGVDAVVCSGDLGDWGLRSNFRYVKEAWDAEMKGTGIVPLFCTGNHDFDGFWYGDMTLEMHALGYSEDDAIVANGGMKKCWEEIFGEPWEPVRRRTVKGFDFISAEWKCENQVRDWMERNGASLKGTKPFFYFQHAPLLGRDGKHPAKDETGVAAVLSAFPNCLAFTGHTHITFNDETNLRQDRFIEISVPSLSYSGTPSGHENGYIRRTPENSKGYAMPCQDYRFDLRGGQGYVVSVYGDEIVVERRDLEEGSEGGSAWLLPLPPGNSDSLRAEVRAAKSPAPVFPAGAAIAVDTRNTLFRNGAWTIAMKCEFPSAMMPDGTRVYDYEIRAVPKDGSEPMVKLFVSPAYAKLPKYEPAVQRFWFSVCDLPQDREYVLEVRARNCFGRCSEPLVSAPRRGKPGLSVARRPDAK